MEFSQPSGCSPNAQMTYVLGKQFSRNIHGASSRGYREEPGLFLKFQGSEAIIQASAERVQGIVEQFHGSNWEFAKDKEDAEDLWLDRKNAHYIGLAMKPGARAIATDVW